MPFSGAPVSTYILPFANISYGIRIECSISRNSVCTSLSELNPSRAPVLRLQFHPHFVQRYARSVSMKLRETWCNSMAVRAWQTGKGALHARTALYFGSQYTYAPITTRMGIETWTTKTVSNGAIQHPSGHVQPPNDAPGGHWSRIFVRFFPYWVFFSRGRETDYSHTTVEKDVQLWLETRPK